MPTDGPQAQTLACVVHAGQTCKTSDPAATRSKRQTNAQRRAAGRGTTSAHV